MIDNEDLKVQTYRFGQQPVTVIVTHKPSGLHASATHWLQSRAKEKAIEELERKIADNERVSLHKLGELAGDTAGGAEALSD